MMKKPKLIYIYPSKSSFIQSDIEFLSKKFHVKTQNLDWGSAKKLPLNLWRQNFFLWAHIFRTEVIIVSFAGYFSLLPTLLGKIFNKKVLIILNGTDCVSFPEFNYGSLRKGLLRFFIKKSQQYASKLLPVDASLIRQVHTFSDNVMIKKQGLASFFNIKTSVKVIPNGFNSNFWNFNKAYLRKKDIITVVTATKKSTAIFKGVDLLVKIAEKFPQQTFTVVGVKKEIQQQFKKIENVKFYPFVTQKTLKEMYQNHKFYAQLSINEGFGCAVAEAMLCGCIPIISNVGALPNVAGKTAFVVKKRTYFEVEKKITQAFNMAKAKREEVARASRLHIIKHFSISQREKLLLQEINK